MNEDKKRHTVWLTSDAWSQVETSYTKDNCTTKNEYIEKAIRFYTGYLNTQNAASYLPRVLADVLEGKLGALGTRIGKLLFKLVVEQDMIANITAAVNQIPLDDLERLRARCIRDAKKTNGVINLEDAVRYQNGWDAVRVLEQLWDKGFTSAAYYLGRVYRDSLGELPDDERAEKWFHRSAAIGDVRSQYALGKLLQEQGRLSEAVTWYERACESGSQYARYSLGKMYLLGNGVPKDAGKAIQLLTSSANQGNQYAQYVLGKFCLQGREVQKNPEAAEYWLTLSAMQGNAPAQFLLDHRRQDPSVLLCTVRLLHHMSNIFWETLPPPNPMRGHVESKLMGRIREKKIAMGHKLDDHEEYQDLSMSM